MEKPADTGRSGREDVNTALVGKLTAQWQGGADDLAVPVPWDRYTHQELYNMLHSQANVGQVHHQIDRLNELAATAESISTKLGAIRPEIWAGLAAQRSSDEILRHHNGGLGLATFLKSMASATSAAADAFSHAQNTMMAPREMSETVPIPFDGYGAFAARVKARDEAIEVMEAYESNLRDAFQLVQLPAEIPPGQPPPLIDAWMLELPPEGQPQTAAPFDPNHGRDTQPSGTGDPLSANVSAQRSVPQPASNGPHGSGEHAESSTGRLSTEQQTTPAATNIGDRAGRSGRSTGATSASSAVDARRGPVRGVGQTPTGMNADGWRALTGRGSPLGSLQNEVPGGSSRPGGPAKSGMPYRLTGAGETARRPGSSLSGMGNAASRERDEEDPAHRNRMPRDEQLFTFSDEQPIAPPVIGDWSQES